MTSFMERRSLTKLVRFLLAGLPAFVVAVPLNIYLVEELGWNKWIAYAHVLVLQVTINFFASILFVFNRNKERPLSVQFVEFFVIVGSVRLLDWAVYVGWTGLLGMHYIAAQLVNVIVFALVKFVLVKRVIEDGRHLSILWVK